MRSLDDCPATMPDYPTLDGKPLHAVDELPTLKAIGLLDALREVEAVLSVNANGKYKGIGWSLRSIDWHDAKAVKHLNAAQCGTKRDHETGRLHRAHAACRLLMSLAHEITQDGSLQDSKAA